MVWVFGSEEATAVLGFHYWLSCKSVSVEQGKLSLKYSGTAQYISHNSEAYEVNWLFQMSYSMQFESLYVTYIPIKQKMGLPKSCYKIFTSKACGLFK